MSYVRHYDNYLLDDLHNYFPALIYEGDAFRDVADVLFYVRTQMRRRMDLYSAGLRNYMPMNRSELPSRIGTSRTQVPASMVGSAPAPAPVPAPAPAPIRSVWGNAVSNRTTPNPSLGVRYTFTDDLINPPIPDPVGMNTVSALLNLLGATETMSLFGDSVNIFTNQRQAPNPHANFMEPVPVVPTAAQIAAGSTIEIVDAENEVCAICQDQMAPGSNARSLRVCDHRFHVNCIDTWYQSHVSCPVCRHDIRELNARQDLSGNNTTPLTELTEEEYREL